MKLGDTREAYYFHSGKLSDICRQLAFGGLALVWIFKSSQVSTGGSTDTPPFSVPKDLVVPSFFMMLTLAVDMLQYFSQTVIWAWFDRKKETEIAAERQRRKANGDTVAPDFDNEQVFDAPDQIALLPNILFYAKVAVITVGYYLLLSFLGHAIYH